MYAREKERQCARERNLKASYKKKRYLYSKKQRVNSEFHQKQYKPEDNGTTVTNWGDTKQVNLGRRAKIFFMEVK